MLAMFCQFHFLTCQFIGCQSYTFDQSTSIKQPDLQKSVYVIFFASINVSFCPVINVFLLNNATSVVLQLCFIFFFVSIYDFHPVPTIGDRIREVTCQCVTRWRHVSLI